MNMGQHDFKLWQSLHDDELISRTAKECIEFINAKGGLCCHNEGKMRIAEKIIDAVNQFPELIK